VELSTRIYFISLRYKIDKNPMQIFENDDSRKASGIVFYRVFTFRKKIILQNANQGVMADRFVGIPPVLHYKKHTELLFESLLRNPKIQQTFVFTKRMPQKCENLSAPPTSYVSEGGRSVVGGRGRVTMG
jgi:hypothetical protein